MAWFKCGAWAWVVSAMAVTACKSGGTLESEALQAAAVDDGADYEDYDLASMLDQLEPIDKLLVAGAKESGGGFGQILLMDSRQRTRTFEKKILQDLTQAEKLELNVRLLCPGAPQKCDPWDRLGKVIVEHEYKNGKKADVEIFRFMTPYGEGAEWVLDVTDYAALLSGEFKIRAFIDTWTSLEGPDGQGWVVLMRLKATGKRQGGLRPTLVVPLLTAKDVPYGETPAGGHSPGDPAPALKAPFQKAVLKTLITGHGQGNAENCAEFCRKNHTIKIGKETFSQVVWRDDCATSVSTTQKGNFQASRAGWCPGDYVRPRTYDVTKALGAVPVATQYSVEPYLNTCRPGSSPCKGCTLGTTCEYDQGQHTPPFWKVSANLILYR